MEERYSSKLTILEKAACYLFLGDSYRAKNKLDKAIYYYNLAIKTEPSYREPYLYAAEIFNERQMYNIAIGYVEDALKNSYRHYNWLERDDSWREKPYDILAISYYYRGDKELGYNYAVEALTLNPTDTRLIYNEDIIRKNLT